MNKKLYDHLVKSEMLLDTMAVNQAHATANRISGDMWPQHGHNTHGMYIPLGDLGGARDALPPSKKFLHFHAAFGKKMPNNRLAPPSPRVGAGPSGKSWILHCIRFR